MAEAVARLNQAAGVSAAPAPAPVPAQPVAAEPARNPDSVQQAPAGQPASLADRLMVNPVVNRTIGLFGGDVISVEDGR